MKKHQWSGYWPTDEYPPDGAVVRYAKRGEERMSAVIRCWCGIEPTLTLENGDTIYPGLDPFEVVAVPSPPPEGR